MSGLYLRDGKRLFSVIVILSGLMKNYGIILVHLQAKHFSTTENQHHMSKSDYKRLYSLHSLCQLVIPVLAALFIHMGLWAALSDPTVDADIFPDLDKKSTLTILDEPFHLRNNTDRINTFNHIVSDQSRSLSYFPDTVLVYSLAQNPRQYTYFYSQKGERLITFIKLFENEEWTNRLYETSVYDENGNLLSSTWKSWSNNEWVNSSRTTYTYSSNKVLTSIVQYWESTGWKNFEKTTNSYDVYGNRLTHTIEKWSEGDWINDIYEIYTFDAQNNLTYGLRQIWNVVYWLNNQEYYFIWDANRNLLSATIKNWIEDEWVNSYKETYTYTANRLSEYTGMKWSDTEWQNDEKYTYEYTGSGFVLSAIGQKWTSNQWVNNSFSQYSYNSFGGIASALFQKWESNTWINQQLFDYSYDNAGNTLAMNLFHWDGSTWKQNKDGLLELYYSNSLLSETFVGYRAEATYISMLLSSPEIGEQPIFSIYPNPVQDFIYIENNLLKNTKVKINLYTIDSKYVTKLFEGEASHLPDNIQLTSLQNGLYLLSIQTDAFVETKKIIINK